jgi:heme exporter protein C
MTDIAPDPLAGAPSSTSSRATRVLGVLSLAGLGLTVVYAFAVTGPDVRLGNSVRIMYVHVPTVTAAYCLMIANALFSGYTLWKRSTFSDLAAHACAEVGVLMLGLTLVVGAIWGRMTWGAFWVWDARLTTTALLFLMYIGYLAIRGLPASPRVRATRSAIVGIAAAMLIPIVHKSVEWWASLHQNETVLGKVNPNISGNQYFTLMLAMVTFLLVATWMAMHRFRVLWLIEQLDVVGVDEAIEARRAENIGVGQ